MKRTPRGFKIYSEFKDTYGNQIRVQESSSACAGRIWIFTSFSDGKEVHYHCTGHVSASPHLSKAQARRLAKTLLRFADGK